MNNQTTYYFEKQSTNNKLYNEVKRLFKKTNKNAFKYTIISNEKSRLIRIIWLLFLMSFTLILIEKVYNSIAEYFDYKAVTNFRLEKLKSGQEFPAITLQILNWLSWKSFINLTKIPLDQNDLISISHDLRESFFVSRNEFMALYEQYTSYIQDNQTKTNIESNLLANSIISCRFNNLKCNLQEDFYLRKPNGPNEVAYLQFNIGKNLDSSKVKIKNSNGKFGMGSGLELELFTGFRDDESPLAKETAIVLYIHEQNEIITNDYEQAILIKPGMHSNVAIEKTVYKILPEPFNSCSNNNTKFNSDLFKLTLNLTGGVYSQKYCFKLCLQRYLIKNCGCYDETFTGYVNYDKSLQTCSSKYFLDSANTKSYNFLSYQDFLLSCPNLIKNSFYSSDYVAKCTKFCPKQCEFVGFKTLISKSNYPSRFYSKLLMKNPIINKELKENESESLRNIKQSVASLNIYFSNENYIHIEEVPLKTPIELISELGEYLSMFLGLSILSSFEIIEFAFKVTCFIIFGRQVKSTTTTTTTTSAAAAN